jgi:hypothetical protein
VAESDVSGAPIEPDASASIVAVFEDGTRRRLTVRSAEATTLSQRGTDETTWLRRARAFLAANARKFVFWALALLVASLAIPAATKQLSDRQQATALKSEIITEISRASAEAFAESKHILESSPKDVSERRLDARKTWEVSQGELDGRYAAYFDRGGSARRAWYAYEGAVYNYISMLCCDAFIDEDVEILRKYVAGFAQRPFNGSEDPWEILRCGDDRRCASAFEFAEAHKWVGLALLRRRGTLLDELRVAQPEGFSSGWGDFLDDTIPLDG